MTPHEGNRMNLTLRRADYDALLDYVVRFRWDNSPFAFACPPRPALVSIAPWLPLIQHEWF